MTDVKVVIFLYYFFSRCLGIYILEHIKSVLYPILHIVLLRKAQMELFRKDLIEQWLRQKINSSSWEAFPCLREIGPSPHISTFPEEPGLLIQ